MVPLVYRALMPPKGSATSVAGAAAALAQFIVRPTAVPLTLAADPLRFTFALVMITGSATLLGAGTSPVVCQIAYSIAVLLFATFIAARAYEAGRDWRRLSMELDRLTLRHRDYRIPELWKPIVDSANNRRYRLYSWALAVTMLLSAAYHLLAMGFDWPRLAIPAESFALSIVGVALLQNALNKRSYRMQPLPTGGQRRKILGWLTGFAAAAVIIMGERMAAGRTNVLPDVDATTKLANFVHLQDISVNRWQWDHLPATIVMSGATVAILIAVSFWGWASDRWVFFWVCVGGMLAAGTQWLLDDLLFRDWRLWDLLPTLIWMVIVGAIAPKMPYREENFGEMGQPKRIPSGVKPEAGTNAPSYMGHGGLQGT
jgi:hypothetical protein